MKKYDFLKEISKRMDKAVNSYDYKKFDHYSRIFEKNGIDTLAWYQKQLQTDTDELDNIDWW